MAAMSAPAAPLVSRRLHVRGLALMLFSTACFIANILLIRAVGSIRTVDVWLVSCVRFVVGLALLATVCRRQVRFPRVFANWKLAARGIIGGVGVAVYYLTVIHLGAGRATFINDTYVIFGALLAVWILSEPLRSSLAVGSLAAIAGLALLTRAFTGGLYASPYDLLAIVGAIGSAFIVVIIRMLHAEGEHTTTIFAAQCVYGLLLCGVPAAVRFHPISGEAWTLMLAAGVCASVGQLAMTAAYRDLPVARGAVMQILVPLGVAAGGFLFFQEQFTVPELIGAALILGGTMYTMVVR